MNILRGKYPKISRKKSKRIGLPRPNVLELLERRQMLSVALAADLTPATFGSDPQEFATLGNDAYFFASRSGVSQTPLQPVGLWKTSGVTGETTLVKSGFDQGQGGGFYPLSLMAAGGRLYFNYYDPAVGEELWTSDGTEAGTHLLKDIYPGSKYSSPHDFRELAGSVYFIATDATGPGLFTTDGTAEGTRRFEAVPQNALVAGSLTRSGAYLYFIAGESGGGRSLWRTDGTVEGTRQLRVSKAFPSELTDVNGELFFTAPSDASQYDIELWKTDGTVEGTALVKDVWPGELSSAPVELTNVNGTLYFAATETDRARPTHGDLWKSDGTADGTVKVIARDAAEAGLLPQNLTALGGRIIYSDDRADGSRAVWASDGTPEGTAIISNVVPALRPSSKVEIPFFTLGDQILFTGAEPGGAAGLWSTDGTPSGTHWVAQLIPQLPYDKGRYADLAGPYAVINGRLIFSALDAMGDVEPWITDGTSAGTTRVADIGNVPQSSSITSITAFGNNAVVGANGKTYVSDGTPEGTHVISDSIPHYFLSSKAVLHDKLIYGASTNNVSALYQTDGTAQGTIQLSTVGATSLTPAGANYVYFAGYQPDTGTELWRTDGTPAGTQLVKDVVPGPESGLEDTFLPRIVAVGETAYFIVKGSQLWKSDGTDAGTALVKGFANATINNITEIGGKIYFAAPSPLGAWQTLWVSDGTTDGTQPIKAELTSFQAYELNGAAFFSGFIAGQATPVSSLYRTDGTPGGTVEFADHVSLDPLAKVADGYLYFRRNEPSVSPGLWRTNGTSGQLEFVTDVIPSNEPIVGWQGKIYFAITDAAHGRELWSSDGSPSGTAMVADIVPGSAGSDPSLLTPVGDKLFLVATDPEHGKELWQVSAPVSAKATFVGARLFYNDSMFDGHDSSPTAADLAAIDNDLIPVFPGRDSNQNSFSKFASGINGLILEFAGGPPASLSAEDLLFRKGVGKPGSAWQNAPAPVAIARLPQTVETSYTRYAITWANRAMTNTWLQVTVKANEHTNLANPEIFYFGNLVGDTGGDAAPVVNATDLVKTRNLIGFGHDRGGRIADFNLDGIVNAVDLVTVRNNLGRSLARLTSAFTSAAAPALLVSPPASRVAWRPLPFATDKKISQGDLLEASR